MRTDFAAFLSLFVLALSLCGTTGSSQGLCLLWDILEVVVNIYQWGCKLGISCSVPNPPPMAPSDWVSLILFFILLVTLVVIVAIGFCLEHCNASVIKLEVAFAPDGNEIENDIQDIKRRANTESLNRRKEIVMSELMLCLQDKLESVSCAKCEVETYWWISKVAENWKSSYIKQLVGMCRKEASVDREEEDSVVVTLLIAAKGARQLPTISHPDEIGIALQKIGSIRPLKIQACEVFCTHGVYRRWGES